MLLQPNDFLNNERYQILRLLSDEGGMGRVYLATDHNLGDTVVIKQSRFSSAASLRENPNYRGLTEAQLQSEAEALQQDFEREAKLLRRLRHDALPRVLDYFRTDDGEQFLVMEFIQGNDFGALLEERKHQQQGGFPFAQVMAWAEQILDALIYLHTDFDPPIIHRDIKPQNLKLTPEGRVVLLDFGLAKGAPSGLSPAPASVPGSSPTYSPLEQTDAQGTDERSDLYALAITLHHLLTGQTPPGATTRAGKVLSQQPDPLRPAHEFNPQVPPPVSAVLQQAAAIVRAERYESAEELRAELRKASSDEPQIVTPPEVEVETIVQPRASTSGNRPRIVVPIGEEKAAQPQSFIEDLGDGVTLEMVYIPGGSFLMGSPESEDHRDNDEFLHRVQVSPFWIGKFQVTQAQWQIIMRWKLLGMNRNPSSFKGDDLPVENVIWDDVADFCARMTKRTGKDYRLPTEAEWEYACRAGSVGQWCFGNDERLLEQYAWYWSFPSHPVGEKLPNQFGLYDMHGNVWEWCQDWYSAEYYKQSHEIDPQGPNSGRNKVLRGGSYESASWLCRAAKRNFMEHDYRTSDTGFRVAVTLRT